MTEPTLDPTTDTDGGSNATGTGVPGPIVVGVDGSPNAARALRVASGLALATGVEVVAVHALGLMATVDDHKVPASAHRAEIEARLHDEWCTVLNDTLGDGWRSKLVDGSPADVLLHTAIHEDASFVVVGARGIGGHPDLMLGSTSHQVIHHATCPAVVVPPADRGPASTVESLARESI